MHLREPGTREPRPCTPNTGRSDASAGPPDLRFQGRPSPPVVTGTYGSRTRQPDLCQCQVSVIRAHHHAFGRAGAGLNSRDPEPSPPGENHHLVLLNSIMAPRQRRTTERWSQRGPGTFVMPSTRTELEGPRQIQGILPSQAVLLSTQLTHRQEEQNTGPGLRRRDDKMTRATGSGGNQWAVRCGVDSRSRAQAQAPASNREGLGPVRLRHY